MMLVSEPTSCNAQNLTSLGIGAYGSTVSLLPDQSLEIQLEESIYINELTNQRAVFLPFPVVNDYTSGIHSRHGTYRCTPGINRKQLTRKQSQNTEIRGGTLSMSSLSASILIVFTLFLVSFSSCGADDVTVGFNSTRLITVPPNM